MASTPNAVPERKTMICKYCGLELRALSSGGFQDRCGQAKCKHSPSNTHVMIDGDSMICKYCGLELRTLSSGGFQDRGGQAKCKHSPTGKHELV
jgi:hypothetical protein